MQNKIEFDNFLIARTPHYPFNKDLLSIENIKNISRDKTFIEAVYLASPSLYNDVKRYNNGEAMSKKEVEKLFDSLYKYYSRMSMRCTPYGLFATCSVWKWSDTHQPAIKKNDFSRFTRIDMNAYFSLIEKLSTNVVLQKHLCYYLNSSLYQIGEEYRFIEYKVVSGARYFEISSVPVSPYLEKIINIPCHGKTIEELSNYIVDDIITFEEARAFVLELIESQIFCSEIEPNITGTDYMQKLQHVLEKLGGLDIEETLNFLEHIIIQIRQLDENIGNAVCQYRTFYEQFKHGAPSIAEQDLLQTDLFRNANDNRLGKEFQNQIREAISLLLKLHWVSNQESLTKFKNAFFEKYDSRKVPLATALDPEIGIRYGSTKDTGEESLLHEIDLSKDIVDDQIEVFWNQNFGVLHEKLITSIKENKTSIELRLSDFASDNNVEELPLTMSVMFKILSENKIVFKFIAGPSGTSLISRFAYWNEEIKKIAIRASNFENEYHTDKIIAEIVHLPERRVGNILLRPVLSQYEIPYLGSSCLDWDKQINISDLTVSVVNNRVVLESRSLEKEIIPRLSSAHNYSLSSIPIYSFLCDLQSQDFSVPFLTFEWDKISLKQTRLPRVEFKNIILSPAKWIFKGKDLEQIKQDLRSKNRSWIDNWQIPKLFNIVEGDHELLIYSENDLSLNVLYNLIKNRKELKIEEFLFEEEEMFIKDEEGNNYTNEFVAIVHNTSKGKSEKSKDYFENQNPIQRDFSVGSEWLYYKFYCGVKSSNLVLTQYLLPLVEQLLGAKLIDSFFFIRYNDPDYHIRFRLHFQDVENIGVVINRIHSELEKVQVIQKIQIDKYSREVERYGSNIYQYVEELFHIDSYYTMKLLSLIEDENYKLYYALLSIQNLFNAFAIGDEKKYEIIGWARESFLEEYGGSKRLSNSLDKKYRNSKQLMEHILGENGRCREIDAALYELLESKQKALSIPIHRIMDDEEGFFLKNTGFIPSLIHMLVNRLYSANQRAVELVVYDHLFRFYKSKIARRIIVEN